MNNRQNIYQMYMENAFKFGFFITRDSSRKDRYAKVLVMDGVKEGKPIDRLIPLLINTHFIGIYTVTICKFKELW